MTTPPPCSCHGARTCRPTQECVRGGFAASGTRAYALYSCVFRAWQPCIPQGSRTGRLREVSAGGGRREPVCIPREDVSGPSPQPGPAARERGRRTVTVRAWPWRCCELPHLTTPQALRHAQIRSGGEEINLLRRGDILLTTGVPVIQCECSTADCAAAGVTTCTTASLCYFQHFDHHDGSHPITRGCITSGSVNSLQCLNLHQAARRSFWPYVVCCGTDYCNRDLMPPLPTTYFPVQDDDGDDGDDEDDGSLLHHYLRVASHHSATTTTNTTKGHHKLPRLNTVCLVVIGAAVAFMVTISIASLCILIRCRSTYTRAPQEPLDVGMEKLKTMEPSAPPLVFAYHPASP
ncbi:hypothetical protein O3P69_005649 [Scylla paramamosain]|uniref:Activin types I and II receptor domain-containing protein n=1 Tax=Scylla paramamosain TaxID=85552 RepID=A0AAW0U8W1_SCYPA